jgi:hypothetical protein
MFDALPTVFPAAAFAAPVGRTRIASQHASPFPQLLRMSVLLATYQAGSSSFGTVFCQPVHYLRGFDTASISFFFDWICSCS